MENIIDNIVEVRFKLERYGTTKIEVKDYVELMPYARSYTIGVGKSAYTYHVVHTSAGYVDLCNRKSGIFVEWLADEFKVKGVVADNNSNHYAVIASKDRTFRIPFENLLPNKVVETLFGKGIAVSEEAGRLLSMHLQMLCEKFCVEDAKEIIGWCYKDEKLTWNGSDTDPPMLKYKLSCESERVYIQRLNMLIESSVPMHFVICATMASTLLAYLSMTEKIPVASFGISLVGTSSTGKTTALQLASSMYSSPDDEAVYSGFYGTQNALTYMLGRHHGTVLCYDESTINNNINNSSFVYTFVEGKDKLRLNPDSTLKARNSWLCTALFSAETPLIDTENSNLGLGVRMMNLEGYAYTIDSRHADEIKTFAGNNYGILCNLMADYLLKADSAKVKEEFEAIKQDISEDIRLQKCPLTDRLLLNYSIILHTAVILNELGVAIDIEGILGMCVDNHNKISESANKGKNLIIKIFNYISSNYKQLKGIKWTTNNEGISSKVAILESTFGDIMKKCEVTDCKSAIKYLDSEGFIIRQSKGRIKAKLNIDGVPCYAYQIDMNKVNEAFGEINDDTFSNVKKYKDFSPFSDKLFTDMDDEEAVINAGNYKVEINTSAVSGEAFLL